jgi:hypothetical protein
MLKFVSGIWIAHRRCGLRNYKHRGSRERPICRNVFHQERRLRKQQENQKLLPKINQHANTFGGGAGG